MKHIIVLVLFLSLGAAASWAQTETGVTPYEPGPLFCQAPPAPPQAPCSSGQPCPLGPEMEKERRLLEAVRVTRMTEALKLSDEQVDRFFSRLKQLEGKRRQLRQEKSRIIEELSRLLEQAEKQKELKTKIEELEKLEQEEREGIRRMMKGLDSLLTIEQQARWRVFNERFDQEIRNMAREIHRKRMEKSPMRNW